jgi:F-type H+-transporting ATPase subunit alpha
VALKQPPHQPISLASQILILLAATEGVLDQMAVDDVPAFEGGLLDLARRREPELLQQINRRGELPTDTREALLELIFNYATEWSERGTER